MRSRPATRASFLALVTVLVLGVIPALAKEGVEAQLDAPVSLDTPPGTTIEVGWKVTTIDATGPHPMVGSPVFVRLVPPRGGTSVEVAGTERPSGSGHYVASIIVPAGGIAEVVVGLRGESCDAAACQRSDILFPLTDDALVAGVPAVAPAVSTPGSTASLVGVGDALIPIIAIATAIALAAGVGTVMAERRRSAAQDPASH